MKALSMMQPYAWLFANGILSTDDRNWPTSYRGAIAIHASRRFDSAYYEFLLGTARVDLPAPDDFDYGGFVGVADLIACTPPISTPLAERGRLDLVRTHFGAPGFFGFEFDSPQTISFIARPGQRGIFDAAIEHCIKPRIDPLLVLRQQSFNF